MMKRRFLTLLLAFVVLPSVVRAEDEISCTASPDCASLGYTQTECASGGIRCPFDKTKMFCISGFGGEDFSFKTYLYPYHIVFSDGTTNTFYNADKDAIGIVTYVHPNAQGNHGIVMALNQPPVETRDEAIKYCANYTTKGTKVGDWHLADITELMTMQNGDLIDDVDQFTNINNVLKTIPGAQALGVSFSYYYTRKCSHADAASWVDCDISSMACPPDTNVSFGSYSYNYPTEYLNIDGRDNNWYTKHVEGGSLSGTYHYDYNPAPGCANRYSDYAYYLWGGYPFYYSSSYWSMSDSIGTSSKPYVANLYLPKQVPTSTAKRGHFRCMAVF